MIKIDVSAIYHETNEIEDVILHMQQARAAAEIILTELEDEYTIPGKNGYDQRIEQFTDALELVSNSYWKLEKELKEHSDAIFHAIGVET